MKPLRIAILGAGPIGIEAALYAQELGHDVFVLEKGRIGENLSRWGHVTLFSPFEMNRTALGLAALGAGGMDDLPSGEEALSGFEHLRRYLLPLARLPRLANLIFEDHRVVTVGKEGLLKGEKIADADRLEAPFRILVETAAGEKIFHADRVIDATGTYGNPRHMGAGGIPAPGERAAAEIISYDLDDPLERDRGRYAGRRTLLVGGGLSAATSALAWRTLASDDPSTSLLWVTRTEAELPYAPIPGDPLRRRAALVEEANRIAAARTGGIRHLPHRRVDSLRRDNGSWRVRVLGPAGSEELRVDRILANVGYRPDESLYSELQIHSCYASSGPMKLAAALLESAAGSDCLSQPATESETLQNPEPGFFILGAKSYGRNSAFLLRNGFDQIRGAFQLIEERPDLDLYAVRPGSAA
ncbi:MAG TPA: NAD(P)-binding domain-containing protein [Candidatus Polarisedimenticolia bacterium]|nr:NAD(P)-binding domain-containing protein [Candidatus Polarisedimenticolia bacterium]